MGFVKFVKIYNPPCFLRPFDILFCIICCFVLHAHDFPPLKIDFARLLCYGYGKCNCKVAYNYRITGIYIAIRIRNISAGRLPQASCPADGKLFVFL